MLEKGAPWIDDLRIETDFLKVHGAGDAARRTLGQEVQQKAGPTVFT
jgi:hypothetical protein